MSELIKRSLKDISAYLNVVQSKKSEFLTCQQDNKKSSLLEEMKEDLQKIKDNFSLIENEMSYSSAQVRGEFRRSVESNKLEYKKTQKEIDSLEEKFVNKKGSSKNVSTYGMYNKIESNTNKLIDSNLIANDIIDRDKNTAMELRKQGEQLMNIHGKLEEAEGNLTVVQQITEVMKHKHLYYKLKLYGVIILLFFANLIVLYLKFS